MKQLEADIKNGIYKNIYLLYGPQSYLRNRYARSIARHFVPEGDTMNMSLFRGKKTEPSEIVSMATTMPFLSDKRVIVAEDTELFTHSCEEIAELIKSLPDTCVLIFSEEKIDQRLGQTKAISSSGTCAKFDTLPPDDLRKWVLGRLGREHRPITEKALEMFLDRCSDDMWEISGELEKLISYTFGTEGIREEDVDAVCPAPAEDKIFLMIDAILDGDRKSAMAFYSDLVILGRDPLSLLREQLRLMLHIKEMNVTSSNLDETAEILGMKRGRIKMALPAARKRSKIYFAEGIARCADLEENIKTSSVDEKIGIEALIIELCDK